MANDDWRITIEVEERSTRPASSTGSGRPRRRGAGARGRSSRRTGSRSRATTRRSSSTPRLAPTPRRRTRSSRPSFARTASRRKTSRIEHWLDEEERWDDEPPSETWEEEELDRGYAPWEVRVECARRKQAHELAEQLETEGYKPSAASTTSSSAPRAARTRTRWRARLHGEVEAGGEVVLRGRARQQPVRHLRRPRPVAAPTLTNPASGYACRMRRSPRGIRAERVPLEGFAAPKRAAHMQEAIQQPTSSPEAADP